MKKIATIFIGLLLIVLMITLTKSFSININSRNADNSNKVINPSPSSSNSLETRGNAEGPVAIAVTPLNLKNNSPTWNFEITLDTHSGALDTDLVAVSELLDDKGKLYKPISWEGNGPEGHHRKGILKFNPISPKPKSIELRIKNAGGILEKSFKWSI